MCQGCHVESVMTAAVIVYSAESDVTSVGGGGTTSAKTLQECQIPH